MSTPIEIVREMQLWRRAQGKYGLDDYPPGMPFSPRQYGEALDAVLRDAERFKRLEKAHNLGGIGGPIDGWCIYKPNGGPWEFACMPLAELADRLREGA